MYLEKKISNLFLSSMLSFGLLFIGCTFSEDSQYTQTTIPQHTHSSVKQEVKVVLDWTPNTNHTGLYVAQNLGYFEKQGLQVEILLPGDSGADAMVASNAVPFGVSYQENVTLSRNQGVPLVSIAAIIQHNTSGFASPIEKLIKTPNDFEGKTYGGWGSPAEQAMIKSVMEKVDADSTKVNIVNIGQADFFTAIKRDIDFAWIYYAWTGIDAELRKEPLNMIYLKDFSPELDYYTPILVTNEKTIQDNPELVKSFMKAVSQGYEYAIKNPEEAAKILIQAVPELDEELVTASQKWLSNKYQDDADKWGIQKEEVWFAYANWMIENKLLEKPFDAKRAFTNDFLP